MHGIKVKPSRYWNETSAQGVSDEVLYALAEYCSAMPNRADIVRDNQYLGIHPYCMLESICHYDTSGKRTDPNVEATIAEVLRFRTLPNTEQTTLEDLMEKVQEVTLRYFNWAKTWPFLAAHRLLNLQLTRCNRPSQESLTEMLRNHPLNSANSASFSSNDNSGNPPASAGSSSQSGGTMEQFSQSAYRSGYGNCGGRGY